MASRQKRQSEEEPQAFELDEPDLGYDQDAMDVVEEEVKPRRSAGPRPRRTAKTRAPKQSSTAPAPRQRAPRREPSRRRDPRQLSLFSRLAPENVSQRVTNAGGSILISLLAIGGLVILFHLFAGSRFFALRGVDVKWPGLKKEEKSLLTAGEVEAMVKPLALPRGVLNADLEKIREELEKFPLIREAQVARLLPDRLRVSIVERRPVALALKSNGAGEKSVVCVDDEGVMFGDSSHWREKPWPPLISGLAEGGEDAKEKNRHWIMLYKRLMAEFDQTQPPVSSRIGEIQFSEDQGVRLILADSSLGILIGKEDFRVRLNVALDILDAIKKKDLETLNVLRISDAERLLSGAKIGYLNVTDPKRLVIGFDE